MTRPAGPGRPDALVGRRFLFVAGPPRSGTTAVTRLLNADDRFALGIERFKLLCGALAPGHFRAERFFAPTTDETRPHLLLPELYQQLRRRWERRGQLDYVGDKYPLYALMLGHLAERFPGCHIVYVYREPAEVARSARAFADAAPDVDPPRPDAHASMVVWNQCARALRSFVESGEADRLGCAVVTVGYRELLDGSPRARAVHSGLYESLGLTVTARAAGALDRFSAEWARRSSRDQGRHDPPEAHHIVDQGALAWVRARAGEPAAPRGP